MKRRSTSRSRICRSRFRGTRLLGLVRYYGYIPREFHDTLQALGVKCCGAASPLTFKTRFYGASSCCTRCLPGALCSHPPISRAKVSVLSPCLAERSLQVYQFLPVYLSHIPHFAQKSSTRFETTMTPRPPLTPPPSPLPIPSSSPTPSPPPPPSPPPKPTLNS